jgi:hypothetical protein
MIAVRVRRVAMAKVMGALNMICSVGCIITSEGFGFAIQSMRWSSIVKKRSFGASSWAIGNKTPVFDGGSGGFVTVTARVNLRAEGCTTDRLDATECNVLHGF